MVWILRAHRLLLDHHPPSMLQCFHVEDAHTDKSSLVFNFLGNNSCESAWAVLQSHGHLSLQYQQQCHAGLSWSLFCASLIFDMRMCPQKEDIKWTSPWSRVILSVSKNCSPSLPKEPTTSLSQGNAEDLFWAAPSNSDTMLLKQPQKVTSRWNQTGWQRSAQLILSSINLFWSTVSLSQGCPFCSVWNWGETES